MHTAVRRSHRPSSTPGGVPVEPLLFRSLPSPSSPSLMPAAGYSSRRSGSILQPGPGPSFVRCVQGHGVGWSWLSSQTRASANTTPLASTTTPWPQPSSPLSNALSSLQPSFSSHTRPTSKHTLQPTNPQPSHPHPWTPGETIPTGPRRPSENPHYNNTTRVLNSIHRCQPPLHRIPRKHNKRYSHQRHHADGNNPHTSRLSPHTLSFPPPRAGSG